MERALFATSAAIMFVLGALHLFYTFFGRKMRPREHGLMARMSQAAPHMSRHTTMWKAWVGVNAASAIGAMVFGLLYAWLALEQPELLFETPLLKVVGLAALGGYTVIAKEYWFVTVLVGVCIALVCFVAGVVMVGR
jgi:hypothetical protein